MQPDEETCVRLCTLLCIAPAPDAAPQAEKASGRRVWLLPAIGLCALLIAAFTLWQGIRHAQEGSIMPEAASSPAAVTDLGQENPPPQPLLPADYAFDWYQQTVQREDGKAYIDFTVTQTPLKLTAVEDAPLPYAWNIVFTMREVGGVPFTITRMTEVFFDSAHNIVDPWVMGGVECASFFGTDTLRDGVAHGYNLSRLISEDIGYGVALEGVDANGHTLAFSLYIPLSQEIERTLTPADFAPAAREPGKAYIAMTPEQAPAPLVEDAFFDGNRGWYYAVDMRNETDIPFTPDALTLALFDGETMSSVIHFPGGQLQDWMNSDALIKDQASLTYRDAARHQPITHAGLRLCGVDANGHALTFAVLLPLAQEIAP